MMDMFGDYCLAFQEIFKNIKHLEMATGKAYEIRMKFKS